MAESGLGDLFDLVHESVIVRDMVGRVMSWNAASADLYGWSETEALGRTLDDLFGADSAGELALVANGRWDGEVRRTDASGAKLVIDVRQALRRDDDGHPQAVVEIGRDITAKLKTETALKTAERRYTNLFQAMAASFWELDFSPVGGMLRQLRKQGVSDFRQYFEANPDFVRQMMRTTEIVDVNDETVRLFAGGDRSLLKGSVDRFWPEISNEVYAASVVAAVGGAPSYSTETRLRRADGTEFEALFTAAFPSEAVGQGVLLIGVIDISERKQAQRELEMREASYRYLFDYMPVSLWQIDSRPLAPFYIDAKAQGVVDLDAHLREHPEIYEQMLTALRCDGVNPRTVSLFGGNDASEFIGPIDRFWRARPDTLRRSMAARYGGANVHTEETRLITFDGREIEVLYVITWPSSFDDGRNGIAGLVDITERVRAQKAERRLQEEFAHAARISMLGELTASIAHEVNQPLAAIATNASASLRWLDRETPDIARAGRLSERILADARRAADIISRIRDMASKQPSTPQVLAIGTLMHESAAFLEHELQSHGVTLTLSHQPGLPPIRGDRTQLQQVLVNLTINAAQAMSHAHSPERAIHIRSEAAGPSAIHIHVEDTGPGLLPDQMDQLFQSFFTTKATGMGMGLAICRSILEQHGGQIAAGNRPEGGAVFTIILPIDV